MESNCKRIVIEGHTSFGIQGVNLREEIERFVKEPKEGKALDIIGKVRNLKDGTVEVICKAQEVDLLLNQLLQWKEKKKFVLRTLKILTVIMTRKVLAK